MAAQFADVSLPEPHQSELLLGVSRGKYNCRIVQMLNPEKEDRSGGPADFIIELQRAETLPGPWSRIPWADI